MSKDGPRPGSMPPPSYPRRNLSRESSVTLEVDMSDFHKVEDAYRNGQLGNVLQKAPVGG